MEEIYGKGKENEEEGCLDLGELVSLQKWDEWVFIALKMAFKSQLQQCRHGRESHRLNWSRP
jgi:hypothetical protein